MSLALWRQYAALFVVCVCVVTGVGAMAAGVVARVGVRAITEEEVRAEIVRLRQSDAIGDALKTLSAEGRKQIVEDMVGRELLTLAASRDGYAERSAVKAAIARATSEILADAYRADALAAADVSDAALRAYYGAHQADFQSPGRVRARHIVTADRAGAEAVLAELARGADFAQLARERSLDPYTRDKGGELGWIPRGVMVRSFEDALFALRPGAVSAPVESSKGFHVIQVEEGEPPSPRSFESVRATLVDAVRRAHLAAVQERLKADFPVAVFPDALKALER
jgi:peptidyl-prolyl cis-trans isomerase C